MRSAVQISIAILLFLTAAATASTLRGAAMDHYVATQRYEDLYYVPNRQWLPVLSLGHREALADILWMRALVYFGEGITVHGGLSHVFEYAEAILELDPDFRAVYAWTATAGLYRNAEITRTDVDATVDILERGAARFPEDGDLAWIVGATMEFDVPHWIADPEERERMRERGAVHLMRAVRLGAAPDWVALTNSSILMRLGQADQAVRHLQEVYAHVSDEQTREQIAARISQIRSESEAAAVGETHRESELQRLREMPYVPEALYFWLGPKVDARNDFRAGFERMLDQEASIGAP